MALVLLTITSIPATSAFPTGAGACPSHRPAVGGGHLNAESLKNGTLEDGSVQVFVDDDRMRPNREYTVWTGKTTEILIRAPLSGSGIKGFLIRLGQEEPESQTEIVNQNNSSTVKNDGTSSGAHADLTMALQPPPPDNVNPYALNLIQAEETYCADANAAGLTHTENIAQYIIKGRLLLEVPLENLRLDVTVVMENTNTNGGSSEFYYSHYKLKAVDRDASSEDDNEDDDNRGPNIIVVGGASSSATAVAMRSSLVVVGTILATILVILS